MKNYNTELVFILDKSGSMGGLEADTIGGYNAMLEKQKAFGGSCRITTLLFDNDTELLHDRLDIAAVGPLTEKDYWAGGSTALLDAIGEAMKKIIHVQRSTAKDYRAEKVLFFILTDGQENSSRFYSFPQIHKMITEQKKKYGWEFFFLGTNIDAVETASSCGIDADRAQNYYGDAEGTHLNFKCINQTVSAYRNAGEVPADWSADVKAYYQERKE